MPAEQQKIFFSYSREDSDFALKLGKDLRSAGANIWIDQLDIPTGARWDQTVEKALADCHSVMIIYSPASIDSHNVMDEVAFALDEGKQIIPLLYQKCNVPFRIRRFQHIDFTGSYENALHKLLSNLKLEKHTKDSPSKPISSEPSSVRSPDDGDHKREAVRSKPSQPPISKNKERTQAPISIKRGRKKTAIVAGLVALLLCAAGFVFYSIQAQKAREAEELIAWEKAKSTLSIEAFMEYENKYPQGTFYQEAQSNITELRAWDGSRNSIAKIEAFLNNYPNGIMNQIAVEMLLELKAQDEDSAWSSARSLNTIEAFKDYQRKFPEGRYHQEAENQIADLLKQQQAEEKAWSEALAENTLEAYTNYMTQFPSGLNYQAAQSLVGSLEEEAAKILAADNSTWDRAQNLNTVRAYQDYLEEFPEGLYIEEANKRIKDINDRQPEGKVWSEAQAENTLEAYRNYMIVFPNGLHHSEAETLVARLEEISKRYNPIFDAKELDRIPRLRFAVDPSYPWELKQNRVEGDVVVEFIIDELGDTQLPMVVETTNTGFNQAALESISRKKWSPGIKDGKNVNVIVRLKVLFSLDK